MSNMVIATNISSLNAHRNIKSVSIRQSRASNNLSTGQRINSAADDSAGLAVSEKMRNQIRGLDQAKRNTQDGISMIQVAEAALGEVHAMISRIRELTVQGANDTYVQEDRNHIAEEIFQLSREITAIEERVDFNGQRILNTAGDDSIFGRQIQTGANARQRMTISIDLDSLGGPYNINPHNEDPNLANADGSVTTLLQATSSMLNHAGLALMGVAGNNDTINTTWNYSGDDSLTTATAPWNYGEALNHTHTVDPVTGEVTTANPNHNNGRTGKTQSDWITFMIGNIDFAAKGITVARANLGAMQNRLEHVRSNLGVASENLSAANSRIRDADMAKDMMRLTQANVLQQAAMSMMAQSNQMPQNVLQLLQ